MKLLDLELIYRDLSKRQHKGVKGVKVWDSGIPGPTLGITIQTHGNEPVGLAVYPFVKSLFEKKGGIKHGRIVLTVNNLRAARKYFAAVNKNSSADIIDQTRFVDVNMNRLPTERLDDETCELYEVRRSRELLPIWKRFDYGLDIHSTTLQSNPMIVALAKSDLGLINKLPFRDVLVNIENVQIGTPASALYGNEKSSIFGLEAGQHTHAQSFRKAIQSVRTLMVLIGMIDQRRMPPDSTKDVYHIFQSVVFPNDSYSVAKTFKTYERIRKGQLIAIGDGGDIRADRNCVALFGKPASSKVPPNEEALFLATKLR